MAAFFLIHLIPGDATAAVRGGRRAARGPVTVPGGGSGAGRRSPRPPRAPALPERAERRLHVRRQDHRPGQPPHLLARPRRRDLHVALLRRAAVDREELQARGPSHLRRPALDDGERPAAVPRRQRRPARRDDAPLRRVASRARHAAPAFARGGGALRRRADPRRGGDGNRRQGRAPRGVARLPRRTPLPARDGRAAPPRVALRGRRRRVPPRRLHEGERRRPSRRRRPRRAPAARRGRAARREAPEEGARVRPACSFPLRRSPPSGSSPWEGSSRRRRRSSSSTTRSHRCRISSGPRMVSGSSFGTSRRRSSRSGSLPTTRPTPSTSITSLSDPRAGAGLAVVLGLAVVALAALRRHPLVSLGIAFFLGTILPTSNVLFPIGTIYADRLAYLPSAGLLAAAAGLAAALPAFSGGFRAAVLGVVLATYAGATVARNEVFRDDERLFDDMVEKVPRSARARYNVAYLAWGRGETVAARASLEKAVALFPRYYDALGAPRSRGPEGGPVERRPDLVPSGAGDQAGLRDRLAGAREGRGRVGAVRRGGAGLRRRAPASSGLRAASPPPRGPSPRSRPARGGPRGLAGGALRRRRGRPRAPRPGANPLGARARGGGARPRRAGPRGRARVARGARSSSRSATRPGGMPSPPPPSSAAPCAAAPRDPKPARLLLELGARAAMARGRRVDRPPRDREALREARRGTSQCACGRRGVSRRARP